MTTSPTSTPLSETRVVKPWPLFGYAPGRYMCRCVECEELFEGDKRAFHCLDCAALFANRALQAPRGNEGGTALATSEAGTDGWVPWTGEPVPPDTLVEYRLRDGRQATNTADALFWQHDGNHDDIIAYRVLPASPKGGTQP